MKNQNFRFKALPFLAALFITTVLSAQEVTVTGVVTDASTNEAMIGATVTVKGTTQGTISDIEGKYSLTTEKGATLVFSSVGYETTEIMVGDETTIDLILNTSFEELEEIVVIGYGSVRKKDVTGAVTSVKSDDFNVGTTTSPQGLLQGKAAGVLITASSGDPGAGSNIRIRGNSSVRAGNDPLIVVDGIPLAGGNTQASGELETLGKSSARNPLNFINPNDIASMDILKDASATAIYGSRGANGVIIITTKSGTAGANQVEYNGSLSFGSIARGIEVHDAAAFASLAPAQDQGGNVNAMDAILQTAISHNHNLAMRGGNQDLKYRLSLGYQDQQGIIKESGLQKMTANLNASQNLLDSRLKVTANILASQVSDQYSPNSTNAGFEGSLVASALTWNPTRDFKLADGSFDQHSQNDSNPLALIDYVDDNTETLRILSNFSASLELAKGLEYKLNLGIDRYSSERASELDSRLNRADILDRGFARIEQQRGNSLLLEHTLTYNTIISEQHRLTALAGYSYQYYDKTGNGISGRDFEYNEVPYVHQLESISQDNRNVWSWKDPRTELQSYFGRLNLSLFEKLIATATIRADGSSKFGPNNKYGIFPSFALAYRLSDESFIPELFDDLKLRVGWGKTGNQEFPAGASQAQYEILRDGITRSQYDNPDLKWETSTTLNAGVDFVILDRKLTGTFEYFNKGTQDLLFNAEAAQPGPSGVRRWTNLDANVKNSGVELALNWLAYKSNDFSLSIGGNASFVNNILENFAGIVETGALHGQGMTGARVQRFIEGQPLNVYYTLNFQGLDDNGLATYNAEKEYFGDPNPTTIIGFNINAGYKGFDFVANFNGAYGHYLYNNTATSVLVASNPVKGRNTAPIYTLDGESIDNAITASSRYLEKGDYLRLNNLSLGYNIAGNPLFFSSLRISITGQNLFVLTDFTGFDPEVNVDKNIDDVPSYGIEYTPYPMARTIIIGLSATF